MEPDQSNQAQRTIEPPRRMPWTLRLMAIFAVLGYLTVSFGVGEFYPFYRFDMFSWRMPFPVAQLMAVDESGEAQMVTAFTDWTCPSPLQEATEPEDCPPYVLGDRFEREALRYLSQNQADGGVGLDHPVTLVRRLVWTDDSDRLVERQCALMTCTARPVGGL